MSMSLCLWLPSLSWDIILGSPGDAVKLYWSDHTVVDPPVTADVPEDVSDVTAEPEVTASVTDGLESKDTVSQSEDPVEKTSD